MRNVEFYSDMNPDIAFVMRFEDDVYEEGKALALEGFAMWCFQEPTEHFSESDVDEWYETGYAEPSEYLLNESGIAYELVDWLDEEGELLPEYENEDVEYVCCWDYSN